MDTNEKNLIRIDNLDQHLYRIYALDKFEQLLASSYDVLVNPAKWKDPFENFFLEATEVIDDLSRQPIPLKNLAADWYGQCWSTQAESDAMWRIYSSDPNIKGAAPAKMGVKVKTTVKKLFALRHKLPDEAAVYPFIQVLHTQGPGATRTPAAVLKPCAFVGSPSTLVSETNVV